MSDRLDVLGLPTREDRLEVRKLGDPWPAVLRGSAQASEDPEQLVDLRVPGEERTSGEHLCQDTAYAPGVHTGRVVLGTKQDLGSPGGQNTRKFLAGHQVPVPEGDHLMSEGPHRHTEGTSQPKVCQLDISTGVDQKVLGLEVPKKAYKHFQSNKSRPVEHPVLVAVSNPLQQLPQVRPHHRL